ncbi:PTS transporter subunit EIIC [Pantoea agglomerans]|uniref:PTS transporter subunit EIIC n=1 Tax=Enterobacter agglomerans TaxID=549 RepID=UPI003C7BDFE2
MKNSLFNSLQKIGKSFVLPIAALPLAGLLLGLGSTLTNPERSTLLIEGGTLFKIAAVLTDSGNVVFGILPLMFAVAVALGLARNSKEVAALSALIAYFVMNASLASTIKNFMVLSDLQKTPGLISNFLNFQNTMDTSVLGGVIIGLIVAWLHNRLYKIKLPEIFAFFSGVRFIPIISSVAAIVVGMLLAFIWPLIAHGIVMLGEGIAHMGAFGTFLFGFILRALIPTGLHHVFYMPFWQTALGGTAEVGGQLVVGAQNILFAQLGHGDVISPEVARFYSGNYVVMMFGFPAAALAMYHTAYLRNKPRAKGLLFSTAVTSFLTGITEPLEFSFIFASPLLYFGIHCVLAGLAFAAVNLLDAGVGYTFSGGVLDFFIYGIIPGNDRTHWIPIVLVGLVFAVLYYFAFRFTIQWLHLKTPGREDANEEVKLHTKQDYLDRNKSDGPKPKQTDAACVSEKTLLTAQIIEGLGGLDNIDELDNCATRLRVSLYSGEKVDKERLKQTGAAGVFVAGNNVQVIYGLNVGHIKTELDEYISLLQGSK